MNKVIVILFLFFLAQNCFAQEAGENASEITPAPVSGEPASTQVSSAPIPTGPLPPGSISSPAIPEHEVEFYIETNKRVYRQGENIYLRFWIKNNGSGDIRTLFKKAYVQFFTDKRGYGLQEVKDFVIDKSGYPRYVILCIPSDKRKYVGSSLKQAIVNPGFYLLGKFNIMVVFGTYWSSNVAPIEVWDAFDMARVGAPDDEGMSGEDFIKQKPQKSPFIVEPF